MYRRSNRRSKTVAAKMTAMRAARERKRLKGEAPDYPPPRPAP